MKKDLFSNLLDRDFAFGEVLQSLANVNALSFSEINNYIARIFHESINLKNAKANNIFRINWEMKFLANANKIDNFAFMDYHFNKTPSPKFAVNNLPCFLIRHHLYFPHPYTLSE